MVFYATKLRALATIAVILIHISARFVTQEVGTLNWWLGNIVDSASRWSVPIFIMLSGMFLLNKNETQLSVIKKRVTKLILPLLLWSFIYSIWQVRYQIHTYSIKLAILNLFQDSIKYHLWYLYAIIGLYLAIPIFKTFITKGKTTDIRYYIMISFFISAVFTTISSILHINVASGFEYFLGYGSYFLLGYYLANTTISKKLSLSIYSVGFLALLFTILGTWYISIRDGSLNQVFYQYLSITTPLVAISVFIFFKHHGNKQCSKLSSLIAKYSLGAYLIHPIFLDIFRSKEFIDVIDISLHTIPSLLYIALLLFITYLSSLLITIILNKIPIIRRFV